MPPCFLSLSTTSLCSELLSGRLRQSLSFFSQWRPCGLSCFSAVLGDLCFLLNHPAPSLELFCGRLEKEVSYPSNAPDLRCQDRPRGRWFIRHFDKGFG